MSVDRTIRQQAHKLVRAHGEDAPIQAAMRAQTLLDQGDTAGSALWGRIGNMTNVLLSKTTYAATAESAGSGSVQPAESINPSPALRDLPLPGIKRWRFQHKALVVTAVRTGLINLADACARYSITIEEFLSWKRLLDEHGLHGLHATRLQEYRRPASRNSGNVDSPSPLTAMDAPVREP
jgi:hypothetical protein